MYADTDHKIWLDDQDFTIPVETKLKSREDFINAMKNLQNGGQYFYRMFEDGKFAAGLKSDECF